MLKLKLSFLFACIYSNAIYSKTMLKLKLSFLSVSRVFILMPCSNICSISSSNHVFTSLTLAWKQSRSSLMGFVEGQAMWWASKLQYSLRSTQTTSACYGYARKNENDTRKWHTKPVMHRRSSLLSFPNRVLVIRGHTAGGAEKGLCK